MYNLARFDLMAHMLPNVGETSRPCHQGKFTVLKICLNLFSSDMHFQYYSK
jgi:hypothetical protein